MRIEGHDRSSDGRSYATPRGVVSAGNLTVDGESVISAHRTSLFPEGEEWEVDAAAEERQVVGLTGAQRAAMIMPRYHRQKTWKTPLETLNDPVSVVIDKEGERRDARRMQQEAVRRTVLPTNIEEARRRGFTGRGKSEGLLNPDGNSNLQDNPMMYGEANPNNPSQVVRGHGSLLRRHSHKLQMQRSYDPVRELQRKNLHPDVYEVQSMRPQTGRDDVMTNTGALAGESVHNRIAFEDAAGPARWGASTQLVRQEWKMQRSNQTRERHSTVRAPIHFHKSFAEGNARPETLNAVTGDRSATNVRVHNPASFSGRIEGNDASITNDRVKAFNHQMAYDRGVDLDGEIEMYRQNKARETRYERPSEDASCLAQLTREREPFREIFWQDRRRLRPTETGSSFTRPKPNIAAYKTRPLPAAVPVKNADSRSQAQAYAHSSGPRHESPGG